MSSMTRAATANRAQISTRGWRPGTPPPAAEEVPTPEKKKRKRSKVEAAPPPSLAPAEAFDTRYVFSVKTGMSAAAGGEIPAGYRMDLAYENGEVWTKPDLYEASWLPKGGAPLHVDTVELDSYQNVVRCASDRTLAEQLKNHCENGALEWFGLSGILLGGTDWAVVRSDAVVQFDGRVTLRSKEASPTENVLISAYISGTVDLRRRGTLALSKLSKVQTVYQDWKAGEFDETQPLNVVLSVRFDAAQASQAWAAPEFRSGEGLFWRYQRLVRGQFIAVGSAILKKASFMPIRTIDLDIYEVTPK